MAVEDESSGETDFDWLDDLDALVEDYIEDVIEGGYE